MRALNKVAQAMGTGDDKAAYARIKQAMQALAPVAGGLTHA
jgi:hypothetical protein